MGVIKVGAISITWAGVKPGREAQMFDVFARVLAYTEQLQKDGRTSGTQVFVPITGSARDTLLVTGSLDELLGLLIDDEFEGFVQEGMLVVDDLTVSILGGGEADTLSDAFALNFEKAHAHGHV
jgi:hypothetical protein